MAEDLESDAEYTARHQWFYQYTSAHLMLSVGLMIFSGNVWMIDDFVPSE